MKRIAAIAVVLLSVGLLAGCPKKPAVIDQGPTGSQVPSSASTQSSGDASTTVTPFGADQNGVGGRNGTAAPGNVIYFDFDKAEIRPEYTDLIASTAKNLTAHPGQRIKLEGNTDERGTREYNIGLGERRAQAVRRALLLQGVAEGQITTVSYGAERPAVEGDDESAWSKNRRVEMVYLP
jgi:peptidoglycan-associated lipoprotein